MSLVLHHSAMAPPPPPPPPAPERPVSLSMRLALGFLHAGALYRDPRGHWVSRQFPSERVSDATAKAIEQRGLARLQEYDGLYGVRRACLVLTPQGRRICRDGAHAHRSAPPVAAEQVLREVETALAALDRESRELADALAVLEASGLAQRQALRRLQSEAVLAEARIDRIGTRLGKLEATRLSLDARRTDLRCLVVHAAERMMESLREDGR